MNIKVNLEQKMETEQPKHKVQSKEKKRSKVKMMIQAQETTPKMKLSTLSLLLRRVLASPM
jgi:hypothetical protein